MDAAAGAASDAPLPDFPCPECGQPVVDADPAADWMCAACGHTHFAAPSPAVAGQQLPVLGPAEVHPEEMRPMPPPSSLPPRPPGRVRPFWSCVGLGVVTLGVYFLYYEFKAFLEVDEASGRRNFGWLWAAGLSLSVAAFALHVTMRGSPEGALAAASLSVAGVAAQAAYLALETRNLNEARQGRGLGPALPVGVLPLAVLAWPAVAALLPPDWSAAVWLLAPLEMVAWSFACEGVNSFWRARPPPSLSPSPAA